MEVEAERLGPGPHAAGQQDGEDVAADGLLAGSPLSLVLLVRIVKDLVAVPVPSTGPARRRAPLRRGVQSRSATTWAA